MTCILYHGSTDVRDLEIGADAVVHNWAAASTVFAYCIYHIYPAYKMQ